MIYDDLLNEYSSTLHQ